MVYTLDFVHINLSNVAHDDDCQICLSHSCNRNQEFVLAMTISQLVNNPVREPSIIPESSISENKSFVNIDDPQFSPHISMGLRDGTCQAFVCRSFVSPRL